MVCVVGASREQKKLLAGVLAISVQTVSFLPKLEEARSMAGRLDIDATILIKPSHGFEFEQNLKLLPENDGLPLVIAMVDDFFPPRVLGVHVIRSYPTRNPNLEKKCLPQCAMAC
ncbi:MAG: hypothetical protein GY822_25365 [Deltaproteobacteria bacterium]|nr:hypothetical protein [Deltaproteobacteria bacterium]